MGIYDRDYIRSKSGPPHFVRAVTHTAVGTIIALNVVVWILQLISPAVTRFMVATDDQVLEKFQIWRLITANFAHATGSLWHIGFNMLGVFLFGRDLEQIYGRRNFWTLYLGAGVVAVLAELILHQFTGPIIETPVGPMRQPIAVLGASGSVFGLLTAFALFFPHRQFLFMLMIPVPAWLLCVLWVVADLIVLRQGVSDGVAHFAHLGGAAFGLLYKLCDLRWERLLARSSGRPRKKRGNIIRFPRPGPRPDRPDVDEVSERIERLLAKISEEGQDSLSEEEWEFLKKNSQFYRSPKA